MLFIVVLTALALTNYFVALLLPLCAELLSTAQEAVRMQLLCF